MRPKASFVLPPHAISVTRVVYNNKHMDTLEIIRQLEHDEALRDELRAILLTRELLEAPEHIVRIEKAIAELVEAQKKTNQTVAELVEAQKKTNQTVAELVEAQKKTNQTVAELAKASKRHEETSKQHDSTLNVLIDAVAQQRQDFNDLRDMFGRSLRIMESGFAEMRDGFAQINIRLQRLEEAD